MSLLINSITQRLFFSFGLLVLNIVIIACFALFFLWRASTISEITQRIEGQRLQITQLLRTDLDFLRFEPVNTRYYETGRSVYLDERSKLYLALTREQERLFVLIEEKDFPVERHMAGIDSMMHLYDASFTTLVSRLNERGFKDFGMEGEMRTYAHELERSRIPLSYLLTLRRHEKDFLLRKEDIYIEKFNALAAMLRQLPWVNTDEKTLTTLESYQRSFLALTKLNYEIGINPSAGLQGELDMYSRAMSRALNELSGMTKAREAVLIRNSAFVFCSVSMILILVSVCITYYTSIQLVRPIKKLSNSISKFIINEGIDERDLEKSDTDEIRNLSQSFIKLSRKLRTQFNEILKQNSELKRLNNELDRFIYSAAHDLKSPLASLDGLIHLAEREINSPQHENYFRMMESSVRKLHSFIRDITDYARNKRQALNVEAVDITAMVNDNIQSLVFLPHADRIQVSVNIVSTTGIELCTDRTRMEIVLKNILANSFRYMDVSKSHCFIRVEGTIDSQYLRLAITDNGIGIGKQHLNRIFDMFYRAVEHSKGTGLGLFLVKESVKMLRGKITVKSKPGEWTTFSLSVPNLHHGIVNTPETEGIAFEEAV